MSSLGSLDQEGRRRITELVGLNDEVASVTLPACPGWSVHDVLAHLSGNCADIVAGNVAGAATSPWTAAQVEARREWTVTKILDEWEETAAQVAPLLDDFPGRYGAMLISDLTSHEHDIRGALDRPGARDSGGVAVCLDFLVETFLTFGVTELGLEPIDVRAGERRWLVAPMGPPARDPEAWRALLASKEIAPSSARAAGSLGAAPFDLLRAVSGRRSADQIRRFDWSVDPEPYIPIFGCGPFEIRDSDLVE